MISNSCIFFNMYYINKNNQQISTLSNNIKHLTSKNNHHGIINLFATLLMICHHCTMDKRHNTRHGNGRHSKRTQAQATHSTTHSTIIAPHTRKGWRGTAGTTAERGYGAKWQRLSKRYLDEHPLCKMCSEYGDNTPATVVDHRTPHKGNQELFWNVDNWQSLCKTCHDSHKQFIEINGFARGIGADGWPVDENHPVNKVYKSSNKLNNINDIGTGGSGKVNK